LRNYLRRKLLNRYGRSEAEFLINAYSEQLAYGHREVLVKYLNLPKKAYFKAVLTHGKVLPFELDPISKVLDQFERPILQVLWRSDAEVEAELNGIQNVLSIGATGLYALDNIGHRINKSRQNIENFSNNHTWAKSKKELLSVIGEKKILIMPFHSWDGDSVKHLSSTFSFLSQTNPANVRVCLGYLDFCNPKIREIYNSYGWRIECAGVRASKQFGSPVGGREEFLYQLFDILNWSDIVLGDELNTGMLYAVCLGKKIGLLPSSAQFEYDYSKWTTSVAAQEIQNKVRLLFPWLIGELISPQIIMNDLFSALGIEKFTHSEKLVTLLPWYIEKSLP
jgi:hypothetical protein